MNRKVNALSLPDHLLSTVKSLLWISVFNNIDIAFSLIVFPWVAHFSVRTVNVREQPDYINDHPVEPKVI